jgi:hypothetical protein
LFSSPTILALDERKGYFYLFSQSPNLLGFQAGVCKHSNLRGDVTPVVAAPQLLEVVPQRVTHGDDAVGHALDFFEPLVGEGLVVEDFRGYASSVYGWVGV